MTWETLLERREFTLKRSGRYLRRRTCAPAPRALHIRRQRRADRARPLPAESPELRGRRPSRPAPADRRNWIRGISRAYLRRRLAAVRRDRDDGHRRQHELRRRGDGNRRGSRSHRRSSPPVSRGMPRARATLPTGARPTPACRRCRCIRGTINTMVLVTRPLTAGALARAAMTDHRGEERCPAAARRAEPSVDGPGYRDRDGPVLHRGAGRHRPESGRPPVRTSSSANSSAGR